MYYMAFSSASIPFLIWLRDCNHRLSNLSLGYLKPLSMNSRVAALSYAKKDSRRLYDFMYYSTNLPCLTRKRDRLEALFAQEAVTIVK
jgi:hypothetical protein